MLCARRDHCNQNKQLKSPLPHCVLLVPSPLSDVPYLLLALYFKLHFIKYAIKYMLKRFILICQSCCAALLYTERYYIKINHLVGQGYETFGDSHDLRHRSYRNRAWSMGEFKPYLSPTAQGGSGRNRNLTELDARILGYINQLKQQSVPLEDIHFNLKRLQNSDWRDLPLINDVAGISGLSHVPVVPKAAHDMTLDAERKALLREISFLEERIKVLEGERKADAATIIELNRELVRAETLLDSGKPES